MCRDATKKNDSTDRSGSDQSQHHRPVAALVQAVIFRRRCNRGYVQITIACRSDGRTDDRDKPGAKNASTFVFCRQTMRLFYLSQRQRISNEWHLAIVDILLVDRWFDATDRRRHFTGSVTRTTNLIDQGTDDRHGTIV
jgi:hypothetical protein